MGLVIFNLEVGQGYQLGHESNRSDIRIHNTYFSLNPDFISKERPDDNSKKDNNVPVDI